MSVHLFGIRHHGPGSARSLLTALEKLQPDLILIEDPPEGETILNFAADPEMKPPVAMLLYQKDRPSNAAFYPYAEYSPEWQAMLYGLKNGVEIKFMDLPLTHKFALDAEAKTAQVSSPEELINPKSETETEDEAVELPNNLAAFVHRDPLSFIAEVAGYADGERWWESMVEQRQDPTQVFEAILELMTALRDDLAMPESSETLLREAYMRKMIRFYEKQRQRIAVVCGAWHAPALAKMPPAKDDDQLLKGLPKVKVEAAWIPWTYERLSRMSGYGAGVNSPAYYDMLWHKPQNIAAHWMVAVAHEFRRVDVDASPAHVLEGVRLAEAIAAMRGRSLPGLDEMAEAVKAVFCFGSDVPMQLIERKLMIGDRFGKVPTTAPQTPLKNDFDALLKKTRLEKDFPRTQIETLFLTSNSSDSKKWRHNQRQALDLRDDLDKQRSIFLHRLRLINVDWGKTAKLDGSAQGTFWEGWQLTWEPEFEIKLIEAGVYGNDLVTAATKSAIDRANQTEELTDLSRLVDRALYADLPETLDALLNRLQAVSAISNDVAKLMDATPILVSIYKYGNVRKTDTRMVGAVLQNLIVRILAGLAPALSSLNDDAAEEMYARIVTFNSNLQTLENADDIETWQALLNKLTQTPNLHGLIAGRAARLLFDSGAHSDEETGTLIRLSLTMANGVLYAAQWVEGFLRESGTLLVVNAALWNAVNHWLTELPADAFTEMLPILRRTFAAFEPPVRRQLGELAVKGADNPAITGFADDEPIEHERAQLVLPTLKRLLGILQ